MKTYQLFCCLMILITCCIFAWKAESMLGEMLGYTAVVISMAVFSKDIIGKIVQRNR